jgi:hypothetical protein
VYVVVEILEILRSRWEDSLKHKVLRDYVMHSPTWRGMIEETTPHAPVDTNLKDITKPCTVDPRTILQLSSVHYNYLNNIRFIGLLVGRSHDRAIIACRRRDRRSLHVINIVPFDNIIVCLGVKR